MIGFDNQNESEESKEIYDQNKMHNEHIHFISVCGAHSNLMEKVIKLEKEQCFIEQDIQMCIDNAA